MSERLTDAAIRNYIALGATAEVCLERTIAEECLARGSEVEGLRAEVERLNGVIDRVRDTLGRRDGIEPEAQRAVARVEAAEAEVARLRAALDEELSTDCEFTGEPNHSNCACCFKPDGSECGDPCDHHKAWRDERDRLRAAAIPEDAEEIAAEVMWARAVTRLGDASLPWTAMSDDGHVKRFWREEARAVLAALRRDA